MALVFVAFLILIGVLCPPLGILMLLYFMTMADADASSKYKE